METDHHSLLNKKQALLFFKKLNQKKITTRHKNTQASELLAIGAVPVL